MKEIDSSTSNILVTGGGGFVGGNFVRLVLKERPEWKIFVVDSMGGRKITPSLEGLKEKYGERINLFRFDLNDDRLKELFKENQFDYVLHFAAKNPSGKEMGNPYQFAEVNIERTVRLLEEVRKIHQTKRVRFVHLSSYEVYGTMKEESFTENSALSPTTPYAASKAGADLFSLAYHKTFGIDVISTRTTNIYGPFQSEDKFIPMIIKRAINCEEIKVFGDGNTIRDWIYVDDHNRGVLKVLEEGKAGEVYNIGANCPKRQIEVIDEVLTNVAKIKKVKFEEIKNLVKFEKGRAGEDKERKLDSSKIYNELSFKLSVTFREGIKRTVMFFGKDSKRSERC